MNPSIRSVAFLLVALAASPPGASAESPAGHHELVFDDPHGIMTLPTAIDACSLGSCFDVEIRSDARGRVSGDVKIEFFSSVQGLLRGDLDGKIRTRDGALELKLLFRLAGRLTFGGRTFPSRVRARAVAEVSPGGEDLDVHVNGRVCVPGRGCADGAVDQALSIPDPVGPWVLSLDLLEASGAVAGSGSVLLDDGTRWELTARGRYDEGSDTASIVAKGFDASRGIKVRLSDVRVSGGQITGGEATYKVLGQRGLATLGP